MGLPPESKKGPVKNSKDRGRWYLPKIFDPILTSPSGFVKPTRKMGPARITVNLKLGGGGSSTLFADVTFAHVRASGVRKRSPQRDVGFPGWAF